eukprot:gene419-347_t
MSPIMSAQALLDSMGDANGLAAHTGDDWSDVKHSERKKRDRILEDKLVLELTRKSDVPGCVRLFLHICIACATGWLARAAWLHATAIFRGSEGGGGAGGEALPLPLPMAAWSSGLCGVLLLPLLFAHGFVLQCFGYCVAHETMHLTAFKTHWVNHTVSFLVSALCFEFSCHEKLMHKPHHTWTNDPKRDPELLSLWPNAKERGFRKVPGSAGEYWEGLFTVHRSVYSHVMRLGNCALGSPVDYPGVKWGLAPEARDVVRRQLQLHALTQWALYSAVIPALVQRFGAENVLLVWIVPVVLGFIPIDLVRNGEHSDCSMELNGLTNTRSTRSHPVVRFLMWNMNFHAEHHLYPAVPWYNLPRLHEALRGHLQNTSAGFGEVNRRMLGEWIPNQAAGVPRADEKE